MCRKIHKYHILSGCFLIVTGIVLLSSYLVEDLYHVMKYGTDNPQAHYILNWQRPEILIKPVLFSLCGILYLRKEKSLYILCTSVLFCNYLHQCLSIGEISYLCRIVFPETAACFGLWFLGIFESIDYSSWKFFICCELGSLICSMIPVAGESYLINIVSNTTFLLFRIPFLFALMSIGEEIYERGKLSDLRS